MKVFVDIKLPEDEQCWSACNGATRQILTIINKTGKELIPGIAYDDISLGVLDKGRHSYIFINNSKKPDDDRVVGIFTCNAYGYRIVSGKELYTARSIGGYGNSESRFGIYEAGTTIATNSYKGRHGEKFYKLSPEKGWECLGTDVPIEEDGDKIQEI